MNKNKSLTLYYKFDNLDYEINDDTIVLPNGK